MSDATVSLEGSNCPGPCVVCGLRNYPLSMGGPSICPRCDCGYYGPNLIADQKRRIEELEALVSKLSAPPPCMHTELRGSLTIAEGSCKSEMWCVHCGKKMDGGLLRPSGTWIAARE